MDINNTKFPRLVRCVRNVDNSWLYERKNAPLLKIERLYKVVAMKSDDWRAIVELEEFPGKGFNSVLFEELEGAE